MEDDLDKLKIKLKESGQEHVLNFWDELNVEEKENLIYQIIKIDFLQIKKLFENSKKDEPFDINSISPLAYIDSLKLSDKEKYMKIGESIVKKGEVAVVSMAGGQRYKTWVSWSKSYV